MMKLTSLLFCCMWLTASHSALAAPSEPAPAPPAASSATTTPDTPTPVDAKKSRGQLLYENHCTRCHESVVHVRNHRKAANLNELYQWTTKWAAAEKLAWSGDEIRDVVDYLNREFYQLNK